MRMTRRLSLVLFLLISAGTAVAAEPAVTFERVFPELSFTRPLLLTAFPGQDDHLVVVEQAGDVHLFEADAEVDSTRVILDLAVRRQGNEEGLLGLAFHPKFSENRQLFLHYTAPDNPRRNVLARYRWDPQAGRIDPESAEVLLEVRQPWSNHNGGDLAFGPDGYLYVSLGDGGAGGDPKNNGQDLSTLLGAILRLDVDSEPADGKRYAIPADNPFVDTDGARPEIWAWGLRNVWRMSFDRANGDLWAGDVGQNKYEEIDLIVRGGNYGWRAFEGFHRFRVPPSGPPENHIPPVVEHGRPEALSITGGYVYRGKAIPDLVGFYVYGDYVSGIIWALRYENGEVAEHYKIAHVPDIASFGEDAAGELYITSFDGHIYRAIVAE
ncbi:MAG: PQQ-dependent sugar dehydrogenase [Phycisphaeraceae bacterium]|nr:PQQ-dependent sugar dehydrogenase [Phycisphaeraceae bacterium]